MSRATNRTDQPVKPARLALLIAAVLTTVVACGGDSMEPTVSLADAQATLQKAIKDAAAAVFPPGFTLDDQGPLPQNCTDSVGKPDGRVNMGMSFSAGGIDQAKNNA